ncbi:peptide/nickel transport system substrate-binding protein/oligopeptide transport system substrate-binding protein [Actinocrispum wychmicini]|uniref:Peptide/nickel transport system substrate-binding protein/oligopeptide transport system substrate-binding protein n=1 Tax=Actinocrispum wychmicini TaxID=1213861 RepID=A0A4R2JLG6_9PSEU|nr:peptide/nickel transport system substrate-binding protein/oligopeptide transport system substrate-binding protein [Actinocrispum wychmicini]
MVLILHALYAGLVDYDPTTLAPVNVMAESITTTDQRTWTVTVKPGWTFDNGEPVDADAYLRAWNFAAYGPNAQNGAHFLDRVQGYADAQAGRADHLSGLRRLDERRFEVDLAAPFSAFPAMLGAPAFLPMAKACAADPKACNETPIGSGPFKMDGRWVHDQRVRVVRNDAYPGPKPVVNAVTFAIYAQMETAYYDLLAGQVDFVKDMPASKVDEARGRLGRRLVERDSPALRYLGFPTYRKPFDDKRIRQAISLAIDRQAISDAVVGGRFTAAKGFAAAIVPGAAPDRCGYCRLDVDRARRLLADAGGWPGGKLQLWFPAGSGAELLMQAVGDAIRKNLGIDYELHNDLRSARYLDVLQGKKVTGLWRLTWVPDYPLLENYLKPIFGTGQSTNYAGWSNAEFDRLIAAGDSAPDQRESARNYGEAEQILAEELPVMPLWFDRAAMAVSDRVENLTIHPLTRAIDLIAVRLKG